MEDFQGCEFVNCGYNDTLNVSVFEQSGFGNISAEGGGGGSHGTKNGKVSGALLLITISSSFGLVGNGLILYLITTSKKFRRPVNYMLGNLAAISIIRLLTITIIVLIRYNWIQFSSNWSCKLSGVLRRIAYAVEGFALVCISIERSRIARDPWKRETARAAKRKITYVWLLSLIVELPQAFFWNLELEETPGGGSHYECLNKRLLLGSHHPWIYYTAWHLFVVVLIPALVLARELVVLIAALNYLSFSCAPVDESQNSDESTDSRRLSSDHLRLLRNGIVFTLFFILVSLPFGIWYAIYQIPAEFLPEAVHTVAVVTKPFFHALTIFHSSFYPLAVVWLSRDLRSHCKITCEGWMTRCFRRTS